MGISSWTEIAQKAEADREKMNEKQRLVDDLYWEYDRMSRSGQETLDKLAEEVKLWNK